MSEQERVGLAWLAAFWLLMTVLLIELYLDVFQWLVAMPSQLPQLTVQLPYLLR